MYEPARQRTTSDEFVALAMEQPETEHYELCDGEVVALAPERAAPARVNARVWRQLADASESGKLPCEAFADGMSVEVDDYTVYDPDALVRCGALLPPNVIKYERPDHCR